MIQKFFAMVLSLTFTSLTFAAGPMSAQEKTQLIQNLVGEYQLFIAKKHPAFFADSCDARPDATGCIEASCSYVSCSYRPDALEIARACSGNYGGACVKTACSKVSCSYRPDLIEVIKACSGNYSAACVTVACSKVSCTFKPDLIEIVNACKNVDEGCVRAVCSKVSCSYRPDLIEVIKSCGGH